MNLTNQPAVLNAARISEGLAASSRGSHSGAGFL